MQILERRPKKELLPEILKTLFPPQLTNAITACGVRQVEEIRLHAGRTTTVTEGRKNYDTGILFTQAELADLLSAMCGDSLYAYQSRICNGYITLPAGIRVGVCGRAATDKGQLIGVGEISGLIVRLPHRHFASAEPVLRVLRAAKGTGGVLVFSPPGTGKTTCLRAAAREISALPNGWRTVIVDTRDEFLGTLNEKNLLLDILVGYPQEIGIDIAVRTLGAELVICDEIGSDQEARAILLAANRGVPILASTHASSFSELLQRPGIARLHRAKIFSAYAKLERDAHEGFSYTIRTREELHDHS